jgi:hypothetical protein
VDTLRIDICYRPLRVGWAIRRGDFDSLRRIARWSHTLWGGRYNPVIVIDDPDHPSRMAETFRIDMIWPVGDDPILKDFQARFPHLISPFYNLALTLPDINGHVAQLLDIHNALVAMTDDGTLKHIQDKGFRVYSWDPADPLADMALMQLGAYPDPAEIGVDYRAILQEALQPEEIALAATGPVPRIVMDHPTIPYLSRHKLSRHYSIPAGWDTAGFFVGSAANFDDLVALWNVRAADIPVWFVDPDHMQRFEEIIPVWDERVRGLRGAARQSGLAAWTRRDDVQSVADLFGGRVTTVCRVRDDSWHPGAINAPMMILAESQVLASVGRGDARDRPRLSFPLADKPFCGDRWFHTQHLIASVSCGIGLYGEDRFTLHPPYIPELNEYLSRTMHFDYRLLRVEPERVGIVIDASDVDSALSAVPTADLLDHVFDLAGFETKLSKGGLIARQLISRLGGLQGGRVFKIPGVRRLIKTHGPNASFSKKSALQLIGGKDPDNPGAKFSDHERLFIEARNLRSTLVPQDVFAYLVERGLFRIGADLTCPACRLASWIALDALKQEIVCPLCGELFDATRQLVDEQWSYRRSGVLGLEKNNQGAVPVVLTLQQLDSRNHDQKRFYSPSLDFKPKDGTTPFEVDFVWLASGNARRKSQIVLAECKDRQEDAIDATDVANLRRAADALPRDRFDAFILLAKLAPFSDQEIALARTLNRDHRHRVIMLTARELEPYFLFERTKKEFPAIKEYATSFEDFALITSQIYFK